jgi:hypothetical protein
LFIVSKGDFQFIRYVLKSSMVERDFDESPEVRGISGTENLANYTGSLYDFEGDWDPDAPEEDQNVCQRIGDNPRDWIPQEISDAEQALWESVDARIDEELRRRRLEESD